MDDEDLQMSDDDVIAEVAALEAAAPTVRGNPCPMVRSHSCRVIC